MKSRMLHGICKLLLVVGCGFLSVVAILVAVAVAVAVVVAELLLLLLLLLLLFAVVSLEERTNHC